MIYSGTLGIPDSIRRKHRYEGFTESDIEKDLKGVDKLVTISAVGALNPRMEVGEIVLVTDLITLFYQSSCNEASFVNLSNPFDEEKIEKIKFLYPDIKCATHVFMRGPHYETYADKEALRRLGADVVGMSLTPEVIVANRMGIPVVAFGLITNLSFVKHSHKDVKSVVEKRIPEITELLKKIDRL